MSRPIVLALVLLAPVPFRSAAHEPASKPSQEIFETGTDAAEELARIGLEIDGAADGDPTEQLFWLYTRATLTGHPDHWQQVWQRIDGTGSESPALLLYRATVALELHRPEEAGIALDRLAALDPSSAESSYPRLLRGDIAQQRGRQDEALRIYESVLAVERSWEALARVAYCQRLAGRYRKADRLYAEAQEPLTVKEMRRWAWLEAQRGLVARDRGRDDEAGERFRRANRAYSGFVDRQLSAVPSP